MVVIVKFYWLKESYTASLNDDLYGSRFSRQCSNSLVIVSFPEGRIPCFIHKFFSVWIHANMSDTNPLSDCPILIASVPKLTDHTNRNYYGHPLEVWQYNFGKFTEQFVLATSILCQCAYYKPDQESPFCMELTPSHVDLKIVVVCPVSYFGGYYVRCAYCTGTGRN